MSLKRSAQVQYNYNTTAIQEFFLVLQLCWTCADLCPCPRALTIANAPNRPNFDFRTFPTRRPIFLNFNSVLNAAPNLLLTAGRAYSLTSDVY